MTAPITQTGGFFGAVEARRISMGQSGSSSEVLSEIQTLQTAIQAAVDASQLFIEAAGAMGTNPAYYSAYTADSNDLSVEQAHISLIISYFTRLGYSITITSDGTTSTFKWVIKW